MRWTSSVAALVTSFASSAQAQYLVNELSFGYGARYEIPVARIEDIVDAKDKQDSSRGNLLGA